jgi:hypothetical protein
MNEVKRNYEGPAPEINSERPVKAGSYAIPKLAGTTSNVTIFIELNSSGPVTVPQFANHWQLQCG